MAKVACTLTLLSLLFAFSCARTPFDIPDNDVTFLDRSTPLRENDVVKPMLLLPSEKPIYETNTPEIADNQKPVEIEKDDVGVAAEEEDLKPVEDENRLVAEEEDQKPVGGENDAEEEDQKSVESENDGAEAVEEDQKPVENEITGVAAVDGQKKAVEEPETQTLDLSRVTVVRFRPINRHFRRPCHHHWMKRWMMMRPRIHGRQMSYGNDMILGGERKESDREIFRGGERKEFDREMFHGDDGERKEFDREMFHSGERMRPPQWMKYHHHHYHHHGEHEGRPFIHEVEEEREEKEGGGGFLDGIRNYFHNHF